MPIQYINTGTSANAGNGDTLRTAFTKINANFSILSTSTEFNFVNSVPLSSTSTGIKGQIAVTTSSMYVCVGTNSWLRFDGITF